MKVTDALRSSRIAAGLTQRQVADMLGVSPAFISDIEQERRQLGEKYLTKLPESMRSVVAEAMVKGHQTAISRINASPTEPESAPPSEGDGHAD